MFQNQSLRESDPTGVALKLTQSRRRGFSRYALKPLKNMMNMFPA